MHFKIHYYLTCIAGYFSFALLYLTYFFIQFHLWMFFISHFSFSLVLQNFTFHLLISFQVNTSLWRLGLTVWLLWTLVSLLLRKCYREKVCRAWKAICRGSLLLRAASAERHSHAIATLLRYLQQYIIEITIRLNVFSLRGINLVPYFQTTH